VIREAHTALINMRNKFYTNSILRKAGRENNYTTPSDIKSLSLAFTGHNDSVFQYCIDIRIYVQ